MQHKAVTASVQHTSVQHNGLHDGVYDGVSATRWPVHGKEVAKTTTRQKEAASAGRRWPRPRHPHTSKEGLGGAVPSKKAWGGAEEAHILRPP